MCVCCLVFLIIKEETYDCWVDMYLRAGVHLPTSPIHQHGDQEEVKERQDPQQSFLNLNAKRKRGWGEKTNPIIHTIGWDSIGMGQTRS